jgi:hypothetical protein
MNKLFWSSRLAALEARLNAAEEATARSTKLQERPEAAASTAHERESNRKTSASPYREETREAPDPPPNREAGTVVTLPPQTEESRLREQINTPPNLGGLVIAPGDCREAQDEGYAALYYVYMAFLLGCTVYCMVFTSALKRGEPALICQSTRLREE